MALFPDPLSAILGAIDSQNNVNLIASQYSFSNPTPYSDPTGQTNTQITLTANSADCPYTGSVTVSYNRLNLADLATMLPTPLKFHGLSRALDVAAAMNQFYGLNFNGANDIQDNQISINPDGSGLVNLIAQPNSLGWYGSVQLSFIAGNFDLAASISQPVLPGLMYPARDESKAFAEMYSYWRDFSSQTAPLQLLNTSTTDFTQLASVLQQITGNSWQPTGTSRYSLQNAVVLYNGRTTGRTDCNTAYYDVAIVQLDPTANLGYSGNLILHYSPPGSDMIG